MKNFPKAIFLSSKNYSNPCANNGDCILIDTGNELVIYDCGCEEHAKRAIEYMNAQGYAQAKFVLSHNDADHFDGLDYLLENNAISEIYTHLLYKYTDDIFKRINDDRRNRNSIRNSIEELYSNIASLSGKVPLKDIFEDTDVANGISIPGPSKDYALNAVAKWIDSRKSDIVDRETIVNAASTQLSIDFGGNKRLLLTGDSSFAAIENSVKSHSAIQLPHHGKLQQAEEIFNVKNNSTIYYVSDNTGDSNGGSEALRQAHPKGYAISYTLNGNLICTPSSFSVTAPVYTYFRGF